MVQTANRAIQRIEVLGVPVDSVDMKAAIDEVRAMLSRGSGRTNVILSVNPEKVIVAQSQPNLLGILRNADLLIPDGIGVVMAARMLGLATMGRVPGAELMPEICKLAAEAHSRVFLYGAKPDVVTRTAIILRARYPGLQIVGTQDGYLPDTQMDDLIARINALETDALFVALGSPRQEQWINRYRDRLHVRVCQGVGGTFDAICGKPRRAPHSFRRLNLEWLYRLVTQPQRAHRQAALPKFAAKVLFHAMSRRRIGI